MEVVRINNYFEVEQRNREMVWPLPCGVAGKGDYVKDGGFMLMAAIPLRKKNL